MILLNTPKIEQDTFEKNSEKILFEKLAITERASALFHFIKNGVEKTPSSEVIYFFFNFFFLGLHFTIFGKNLIFFRRNFGRKLVRNFTKSIGKIFGRKQIQKNKF